MKHWIIAAVIGLVLAIAGPRALEAFSPDSDPWDVLSAAGSASLWALLPSLVIGWYLQRGEGSKSRYLPALIAVVSTIILLILVVWIDYHLWLWRIGALAIVPLVMCGPSLAYILIASVKPTK